MDGGSLDGGGESCSQRRSGSEEELTYGGVGPQSLLFDVDLVQALSISSHGCLCGAVVACRILKRLTPVRFPFKMLSLCDRG